MQNAFSNILFLVEEGPELSGKSSAVARLGQIIEHAIPTLTERSGVPIHLKKLREPGGSPQGDRGRAFVLNILALQETAQTQLSDETKAELFTWARWGLYDDLVPETESTEGINIYLGDRSYLSMMALQGKWADRPNGVELQELEESALWATKGLLPDVAILRKFPSVGLSEDISFRQLMIMLKGREIMPQDLVPYGDFVTVQNRFDELAHRYGDSLNFHEVNASESPLLSTQHEIAIVAKSLTEKFPSFGFDEVLSVLMTSYETIKNEGSLKEAESMLEDQNRVRRILAFKGLTAEQVMDSFRAGDNSYLKEITLLHNENTENGLPRQARK